MNKLNIFEIKTCIWPQILYDNNEFVEDVGNLKSQLHVSLQPWERALIF